MRWRSGLFVPGNATERIQKASSRGADAIILDLEDGVAPSAKPKARAALPDHIAKLAAEHIAVVVRINADWQSVFADLGVAVQLGVSAIMVPTAENPARLIVLAEMLGELAAQRGDTVRQHCVSGADRKPGGAGAGSPACSCTTSDRSRTRHRDFSLTLGVAPTPRTLALPVQQLSLAAPGRGIMALAAPISMAITYLTNPL